jgi:predicted amidohydrolase YtcJ
MVMIGGNVVTVDNDFSVKQAIAIKGDRIAAVGMDEEIEALVGADTKTVDLQGKTVLPGINDGHIHVAWFGGTIVSDDLDLGQTGSIEEIVALVANKVKDAKPGQWITGHSWKSMIIKELTQDPKRMPTKRDLDPVSPDNPVCLRDFSGHNLWVNSKALELAGVTEETLLPSGGEIVRDPDTSELTGMLKELPAIGLVTKVLPSITKDHKREAIVAAITELNSLGITSITDGALGPGGGDLMDVECIGIYNDLCNEGRLTIRLNILLLFGEYGVLTFSDLQEGIQDVGVLPVPGNEWIRTAGIKIFADGLPGRTAWMYDEYPGGGHGSLVLGGETDEEKYNELINMIVYAHKYGFQLGIHSCGDRAIDACTDGFEKALDEIPRDARHYIIHGPGITDACIKRALENNIGLSAQPGLWQLRAKTVTSDKDIRSSWPDRVQGLIRQGVNVTASSDAPVTYPNWVEGVSSLVIAAGVSREQAIRAYTMNAAWQNHMERKVGSIEVGKLADLCVLDKDILTVDNAEIDSTTNVMTIVGGKIVYRDKSLDIS